MRLRPTETALKEINQKWLVSVKMDLPGAILVTAVTCLILALAAGGGYLLGARRQVDKLKQGNIKLEKQLNALDQLEQDPTLKEMFVFFTSVSGEERGYHQHLVSRFNLSSRKSREVWEILEELKPHFEGVAEFYLVMRVEGIEKVDFEALKASVDRAFEATASTLCIYLKVKCLRGVLPHQAELIKPPEAGKKPAKEGTSRGRKFSPPAFILYRSYKYILC